MNTIELDKSSFYVDCQRPTFTHNTQDVLFDIENKKVFIRGVEYAKIICFETEKRPDGFHITAKVSLVSENKYLNGKDAIMEGHIALEDHNQ
jgi:hypothetical protein